MIEEENNEKEDEKKDNNIYQEDDIQKHLYIQNQIRIIINATKYLKKSVKKLPKYYLNKENRQKLVDQYNELVDIIIEQLQ